MVGKVAAMLMMVAPIAAAAQQCPSPKVPPMEARASEVAIEGDKSPVAQCPPLILQKYLPGLTQLENVTFSRSPVWGDIVRIDFSDNGSGGAGRYICYEPKNEKKLKVVIYDLKTGNCFRPDEHKGYFTIYPPLSEKPDGQK